jgi:hypothetical protein
MYAPSESKVMFIPPKPMALVEVVGDRDDIEVPLCVVLLGTMDM